MAQPEFDDGTRQLLGQGVLAYFAKLYPWQRNPVPQVKIIDIVEALGNQKKAAKLIGVTDRTLRRWANGAKPTPANIAKIDKAYRTKEVRDSVLRNHLERHGFRARNTVEDLLYKAIQRGDTSPMALGAILAEFMVRHGVPKILVAHTAPTFTTGMDDMNIRVCTVSDDDDRGEYPFHIGNYA